MSKVTIETTHRLKLSGEIKAFRIELGMTRSFLARQLGWAKSTLQAVENGTMAMSEVRFKKCCSVFGERLRAGNEAYSKLLAAANAGNGISPRGPSQGQTPAA